MWWVRLWFLAITEMTMKKSHAGRRILVLWDVDRIKQKFMNLESEISFNFYNCFWHHFHANTVSKRHESNHLCSISIAKFLVDMAQRKRSMLISSVLSDSKSPARIYVYFWKWLFMHDNKMMELLIRLMMIMMLMILLRKKVLVGGGSHSGWTRMSTR